MPAEVLSVDSVTIARAAEVLRGGGLVAFPTETVYGLGANALDNAAVRRIFAAKGRPANNPLIVHTADAEQARFLAAAWPEAATRLAERFWPGPLTLVLPRGPRVLDVVTAGGPTVAIRIPAHPVALALLRAAGVPVAAPSANRSSWLSPTRAEHVVTSLGDCVDVILDGGPTPGGIESTVLDLTASPPRLLRPGLVTPAEIETLIGPVARPSGGAQHGGQPLASPGMLPRHYSPRTPLECVEDGAAERVGQFLRQGLRVGWLTFGGAEEAPSGLTAVAMPAGPKAYAAALYAALHRLDGMGLDRIIADLPPDAEEWLAVRDRLRRAAAPPE